MAVTSSYHVWSGEVFSDDTEGTRSYQELYRVISNDPAEDAQAVKAAVPALGSTFWTDAYAYCRNRSARRADDTRLVWEVTVDYEYSVDEPVDDPLDEPVKFRWTAGQYTKAVIQDRNGDAIVNSAGDYFDPPPEAEDVRWSCSVQANVASVPSGILAYAGKINDTGITVDGLSVGTGLARVIALDISEEQTKNDITFRVFTYTLEFRAEGYDLSLLDQGYRILDGTDQVDILNDDEDGNKVRPSAPVLLDGSGDRLADPSPTSAVYLDFAVYGEMDFAVLPGLT